MHGETLRRFSLTSIFLGRRYRNLGKFFLILIPSVIAALLEGISFACLLLAFSQMTSSTEMTSSFSFLPLQKWANLFKVTDPLKGFICWILGAVFLQGLRSVLVFFTSYLTSKISLKIQVEAQSLVVRQILRLSFSCVNRYRLGDLVEYAKTPSTFIPPFMDAINKLINSGALLIASLVLMLKIAPLLTLITWGLFAGFFMIQKNIIQIIVRHSSALSIHATEFGKLVIQILENLRLVHVYQRQKYLEKDLSVVLGSVAQASRDLYFWHHSIPSVNELIAMICMGSVLVSGIFILDYKSPSDISCLFTFLILAYRGSTRMQALVSAVSSMAVHFGPILRLRAILSDDEKEYLPVSGAAFESLKENIVFRSVSLCYAPNLPYALKDLSFTLPLGKITAIVGPSGAGKTSVIDLLTRLYEPTGGEILVNGVPFSHFDLGSWREALGVVSQECMVFNDTVESNIRFGFENASYQDIVDAATLSGAHEFIMRMKEGYRTQLGERGYKLSGGEIQRISFARALLRKPNFLILDEATSQLDSKTEQTIQQALEMFSHHRTVLIVAHRLSTVTCADQILYIDGGQLMESGTHQQLLARRGRYADLWEIQSKAHHEVVI